MHQHSRHRALRGRGRPEPSEPSVPAREAIDFPANLAPAKLPEGFLDRATAIGVTFENDDLERLGVYLALLLAANQRVNLTAIKDPADAWDRHLLDSLTLLAPLAELPEGSRIIDIGAGGGLPGLPIAIARPDLHVTLLDATAKKCAFLNHAITELKLDNAQVIHGRAEQVGQDRGARVDAGGTTSRTDAHRASYDAVLARAVGPMRTIVELTAPFAKAPGGLILLIKGQRADEELAEAKRALHLLHLAHAGTIDTPTGRIVALEALRPAPKIYPRSNGEPKRSPL